jgi:hypothetical protein
VWYGHPNGAHSFDTVYLPLNYSGNPGVTGVSHRGILAGRRVLVENARPRRGAVWVQQLGGAGLESRRNHGSRTEGL